MELVPRLHDVMLYRLTGTASFSARLYGESFRAIPTDQIYDTRGMFDLSQRDFPLFAPLGGAALHDADLLQRARQGRTSCGVQAAQRLWCAGPHLRPANPATREIEVHPPLTARLVT